MAAGPRAAGAHRADGRHDPTAVCGGLGLGPLAAGIADGGPRPAAQVPGGLATRRHRRADLSEASADRAATGTRSDRASPPAGGAAWFLKSRRFNVSWRSPAPPLARPSISSPGGQWRWLGRRASCWPSPWRPVASPRSASAPWPEAILSAIDTAARHASSFNSGLSRCDVTSARRVDRGNVAQGAEHQPLLFVAIRQGHRLFERVELLSRRARPAGAPAARSRAGPGP